MPLSEAFLGEHCSSPDFCAAKIVELRSSRKRWQACGRSPRGCPLPTGPYMGDIENDAYICHCSCHRLFTLVHLKLRYLFSCCDRVDIVEYCAGGKLWLWSRPCSMVKAGLCNATFILPEVRCIYWSMVIGYWHTAESGRAKAVP